MSSNKRSLLRTLFTANAGCGCSKPKPSDVYEPIPKPKISIYQNTNPSSLTSSTTSGERNGGLSVDDEDFTSTTISEAETHDDRNKSSKNYVMPKRSAKLIDDSIAVEKDSSDPYQDFRNSMLQMIFQKEICSQADLQELLQCFLQLNAPCHHRVIVEVFTEICEEVFPKKPGAAAVAAEAEPSRRNQIIRKSQRMLMPAQP